MLLILLAVLFLAGAAYLFGEAATAPARDREVSGFSRAIIQADQLGISLGRILRVQATDTRLRRQAAAEEKGIECRVAINDMHEWLSGRTYAETSAWAKVLIDAKTDRVVGAHLVGHAGEELIHIFALAMKHGITASEVRDLIYGFPTFSADIKSLL